MAELKDVTVGIKVIEINPDTMMDQFMMLTSEEKTRFIKKVSEFRHKKMFEKIVRCHKERF